MKSIFAILILASGLGFGGAARADFQDGLDAYGQGQYATALQEFRPLAEQGFVGAQFALGRMCDIGKGVPQDDKEAMKWYRKAAEQGFASAQNSLGAMYINGEGVPQDNKRGHMWSNISAANGYKNGTGNRDILAKRMTPADISEAQDMARRCMESNYNDC